VPKAGRVAVLTNPAGTPAHPFMVDSVKTAARSLGVQLQLVEARVSAELDTAFAAMAQERAGAMLLIGDPLFFLHRARLADLARKHRLPSMSTQAQWAEAGGLMSYGPSVPEIHRRAATYVDKVLRGAKPADLPIEEPTTFELVINMKTVKALGLRLPQSL